ncbi:toxin-antitoxin system HicB family antitoxin [Pusillimonas sp.]|uniref:toxin-antitoxin system HicB family antitoxin n=1 Tax=Pusillimonas sp. TaxID=3040095 RepID=UPI0029ACAB29|nr:toxin-antitoxin system HicB family antitoxin [Pusillimonas sp.]MDX3895995.1 toxin-antitoxin system HicB family antitoxin [Pusillimonas sp.]
MNTFDPSRYTLEIKRVDTPDGALYEAKVKEVPGVAAYSECAADAFDEARESLNALWELAQEQGQDFPAPLPQPGIECSGRVTLRMSKSLHHRASLVAEREGVSLNTLITEALSERVFSAQAAPNNAFADLRDMMRGFYSIQESATPFRLSRPSARSYEILRSTHGDQAHSV